MSKQVHDMLQYLTKIQATEIVIVMSKKRRSSMEEAKIIGKPRSWNITNGHQ